MSTYKFRPLSDSALQLLEKDWMVRAIYLDFLTVLNDVINARGGFVEPSFFKEDYQAQRLDELVKELPEDAEINRVAIENREKALALASAGAVQAAIDFNEALLGEYTVVRLLLSRGGARRVFA